MNIKEKERQFENGGVYHLVLKGIDGRKIFNNIDDYYRFIFSIYEFNNSNSVSIKKRRETIARFKRGRSKTSAMEDGRKKLVEVLAFCFMPNHVHLLVKQLDDNGVTEFMRKVGTGYANYFNKKYDREGHLFQSKFNSVHIKNDGQLKIVFAYIHTNPISLIYSKWKEVRIKPEDVNKIKRFLKEYKWSSYLDHIGIKNFPSVTDRENLLNLLNNEKGCEEFIDNWMNYKGKDQSENEDLFLE
ncbi:transposase [Patescibacteria group bacterium]|nr:transposase [Patescibacteria group bacterium]